MLNIDGYVRLDRIQGFVKHWIGQKLNDCALARPAEESFKRIPIGTALEDASRSFIEFAARTNKLALWAASATGQVAKLDVSVFGTEQSRKRYSVKVTRRHTRDDGTTFLRRLDLEELVSDSDWAESIIDVLVKDLKETREREREDSDLFYRQRRDRRFLPYGTNSISLINWRTGCIDSRERQIVAELRHDCQVLFDKAQRYGFDLPKPLGADIEPTDLISDPSISQVDGRTIVVKVEEAEYLHKLLFTETKDSTKEADAVQRILDYCEQNPNYKKSGVKAALFPDGSTRQFYLHWSLAAAERPELSKPGRKSRRRIDTEN